MLQSTSLYLNSTDFWIKIVVLLLELLLYRWAIHNLKDIYFSDKTTQI